MDTLTGNKFYISYFRLKTKGRYLFNYTISDIHIDMLTKEIERLLVATTKDVDINVLLRRNKRVKDILYYLNSKNIFRRRLYNISTMENITKEDLHDSWYNVYRILKLYIRDYKFK